MPELPEVESIRRSLEPRLLGRTVRDVTLHRRDMLVAPGDPFGGFSRQRTPAARRVRPRRVRRSDLLLGATVTELRRLGKQLAIIARDQSQTPRILIVQLGMSGQLFCRGPGERVPQTAHIHAEWRFDDGRLIFRDPRRFGTLRTLPSFEALEIYWDDLGPDALSVSPDQLGRALHGSQRAIKAALLDQHIVAGVGNIYADEALFIAGIAPQRACADLTNPDCRRLAGAIRAVLASAITAGGSTLRDYVDASGQPGSYQASHAVYGRGGEPCLRCGRTLTHASLAQRMTVWCPFCQR